MTKNRLPALPRPLAVVHRLAAQLLVPALLVSCHGVGPMKVRPILQRHDSDAVGVAYKPERDYLAARRVAAGQKAPTDKNIVGLAFSGGGVRSATINLGVLQGLHDAGMLNKVDYLSGVSGGSYIASWYVSHVGNAGSRTVNDLFGRDFYKRSEAALLEPGVAGALPADNFEKVPSDQLKHHGGFVFDPCPEIANKEKAWVAAKYLYKMPVNLIFDVGLHFKPERGKFNWYHHIYDYRKALRRTYMPPYEDEASKEWRSEAKPGHENCGPRIHSNAMPNDVALESVNPTGSVAPYLIVNANLVNASDNKHFEFTRDYCGAPEIGYIDTPHFDQSVAEVQWKADTADGVSKPADVTVHERQDDQGNHKPFLLATAVSASGAALDAAGDPKRRVLLDRVLKPLNLNLRFQTHNFGQNYSRWWQSPFDRGREVLTDRFYPTTKSNTLYLTDGGHYDNLGMSALVMRRVPLICVIDATQDGDYDYGSLRQSMEALHKIKCATCQSGMAWSFDCGFNPKEIDRAKFGKGGSLLPVLTGWVQCEKGCPGYRARVTYVKSSYRADYCDGSKEMQSLVKPYAEGQSSRQKAFPHINTFQLAFKPDDFDAYRAIGRFLGQHAAKAFPTAK